MGNINLKVGCQDNRARGGRGVIASPVLVYDFKVYFQGVNKFISNMRCNSYKSDEIKT